jgi:hypothetical protein
MAQTQGQTQGQVQGQTPPQPTAQTGAWESARKLLLLDDAAGPAQATRIIGSPYTFHYSPSPNHRPTWMIGGEKQYANGLVLGGAYFSNSFGQDSAIVYRGRRLTEWGPYPQLYAQWTAGLMYGYKHQYADEVPLNLRGFSPAVVLAVGWQISPRYAFQVNALGTAALMFQFSAELQ